MNEVIDLNTIFNDFNINYHNNQGLYLRYEGEEVLLGVVRDRDHQVGLAHHLLLPALHPPLVRTALEVGLLALARELKTKNN